MKTEKSGSDIMRSIALDDNEILNPILQRGYQTISENEPVIVIETDVKRELVDNGNIYRTHSEFVDNIRDILAPPRDGQKQSFIEFIENDYGYRTIAMVKPLPRYLIDQRWLDFEIEDFDRTIVILLDIHLEEGFALMQNNDFRGIVRLNDTDYNLEEQFQDQYR